MPIGGSVGAGPVRVYGNTRGCGSGCGVWLGIIAALALFWLLWPIGLAVGLFWLAQKVDDQRGSDGCTTAAALPVLVGAIGQVAWFVYLIIQWASN